MADHSVLQSITQICQLATAMQYYKVMGEHACVPEHVTKNIYCAQIPNVVLAIP